MTIDGVVYRKLILLWKFEILVTTYLRNEISIIHDNDRSIEIQYERITYDIGNFLRRSNMIIYYTTINISEPVSYTYKTGKYVPFPRMF